MTVGGAAPPRAMIEAFGERHGLHITHGWGMTEMCPIGTISGAPGQELGARRRPPSTTSARSRGRPSRSSRSARAASEGLVPWDGESMGELEVRGPSISSAYYESPDSADRWTDDGWFKTGDIVTIGPDGYVEIQDRAKDLVKSGGEWISTVALENALMGHPAIAEAAVIAIPDEKWSERPLAVCVLREGASATDDELREYLAPSFAKFWLPDRFEFVDEIPKTAVGKFRKTALREQFATPVAAEQRVGDGSFVSTERRDAVALVTIDNPPMNALSSALLEELEAEIDALDADDDVRAIVLRGAGERAFVAGADIKEFPALRESASRGRLGPRDPAARPPHGRGAHAVRRRDPRLLPRRRARARDVLRRARVRRRRDARPARDQARPDPGRRRHAAAAAARRRGPRDAPQPHRRVRRRRDGVRLGPRREGRARSTSSRTAALAIAGQIAAQSPHAVAVLRELARTTRDLPLEEGLRREADGFVRCLRSEDGAEGVAAFIEKRAPTVHRAVSRMKAVVLDEGAEPRAARRARSPRPRRARSSSTCARRAINFADVLIREGRYPQAPPLPVRARERGRRRDRRRPAGDRLRPRRRAADTPSAQRSRRTGCSTSRTARRSRRARRS